MAWSDGGGATGRPYMVMRRSASASRGGVPEGTDRHGAQLFAEGQRGGAGVKDDAGDEVVAQAVGEAAQAAEVVGSDGRGCLDLDAHDVARSVLEDRVHLELAVIA